MDLRALKHDALKRDRGRCLIGPLVSDPRCAGDGTQLHHIIPRSRPFAGLHTLENVAIACVHCHDRHGQSRRTRTLLFRHLQSKFGYAYTLQEYREYL